MLDTWLGQRLHRTGWLAMRTIPGLPSLVLGERSLAPIGWTRSIRAGKPVDAEGHPLPWLNYATIWFLEERLQPQRTIFEYGSGNSTLWWAGHLRQVVSCEHDAAWAGYLRHNLPANVTLMQHSSESASYPAAASTSGQTFDLVFIDGRRRADCAHFALKALRPEGVIILDDADQHPGAVAAIEAEDYRRLDFVGLTPATVRLTRTALFYRPENWLGI